MNLNIKELTLKEEEDWWYTTNDNDEKLHMEMFGTKLPKRPEKLTLTNRDKRIINEKIQQWHLGVYRPDIYELISNQLSYGYGYYFDIVFNYIFFKKKVSIDTIDEDGWTLLMRCAAIDSPFNRKLMRELIKNGANINYQCHFYDPALTPDPKLWQWPSFMGKYTLNRYLQDTALTRAVLRGDNNITITKMLLEAGADPKIKSARGTALDIVKFIVVAESVPEKYAKTIELLEKCTVDP